MATIRDEDKWLHGKISEFDVLFKEWLMARATEPGSGGVIGPAAPLRRRFRFSS
jgi:hypothetical protein